MRVKKSERKGGDRRCLGGDGRKAYQRDFGEGVSWSREQNCRRQAVGSKEKESLPIFGGSEETFRYGFFVDFLFILSHFHCSSSFHLAT